VREARGVETEDGAGGQAAMRFGVDVDRGQRWSGQSAVLGVVVADHGQVVGGGEPEVVHRRQDAAGDVVVERGDGGHRP
jgi:hypothetical protein